MVEKFNSFVLLFLLPELLTNRLNNTGTPYDPYTEDASVDDDTTLYCICREPEYGPMIGCDASSCKNMWFHFSCVGVTEEPDGEWYCPDCRQSQ